ncbi:MAG: FeoA domain-containing protein [bacterium]
MSPTYTFIIGLVIVIIGGILLHPKWGLLQLWKKIHNNSERVLIEDGLKHIFDNEYRGTTSSSQSLAGILGVTVNKAFNLVAGLEKMGLVKTVKDEVQLTEEGRSYALRVIRVHRIWERYLADETSLKESEWHQEAEYQEHNISFEEANKIAAQIGNPLFDPHGDPIPSEDGRILDRQGVPLSNLEKGEMGFISHIEDEPTEIFSQIIALGIYPGMQVRLIDLNNERIRFTTNGEECILAPSFAQNITVVKDSSSKLKKKYNTLNLLSTGDEAVVAGISPACRGIQRRRLMDFGIVPGTKISAELESFSGDPRGYLVRGTTVAIRNKQAEHIYIEKKHSEILNG